MTTTDPTDFAATSIGEHLARHLWRTACHSAAASALVIQRGEHAYALTPVASTTCREVRITRDPIRQAPGPFKVEERPASTILDPATSLHDALNHADLAPCGLDPIPGHVRRLIANAY